jgi:hypothetical protein
VPEDRTRPSEEPPSWRLRSAVIVGLPVDGEVVAIKLDDEAGVRLPYARATGAVRSEPHQAFWS